MPFALVIHLTNALLYEKNLQNIKKRRPLTGRLFKLNYISNCISFKTKNSVEAQAIFLCTSMITQYPNE